MFKKTKSVISIILTAIKFIFLKILRGKSFRYGSLERFSPGTTVNIWKGGKMTLGNKVRAHTGTRLNVTRKGELSVGDNTSFNYNCMIVAKKSVKIGKDCTFGPGVLVYDHDHDFRGADKMNTNKFVCEDVIIGNNVWIGANSIILKGAEIGDNCVVAAGTVVRGKISADNIIYNPKETAVKPY